MTLNCWIVDDEPLALSLIESYVEKTPFLKLTGKFSNAVSAMNRITEEQVDVLFLDIQMPEVNGMEFARVLSDKTQLIFTTAFSEYAVEGYKVNAIDYLLKPFSYSEFLMAAKKALNRFEADALVHQATQKEDATGIFVKSDYKLIHVMFDDILYIEGLKDYVKIYTAKETKPILSLLSMKSLDEDLPSSQFVRVHRSYIVQINKIESIKKNRIIINNKEIPIGNTYRESFFAMIERK